MEKILKKIYEETLPISIFLYGSRARTDFKNDSDYEIGIIYKRENKISRSELTKKYGNKNLSLYPFIFEDLEKYNIDTPFPKAIYIKELVETGKTIFGEKILENMESPKITTVDLIERTAFDVATAFAAVRSFRNKDLISTSLNFKSALFGTRVLEILKLKKFPYTYDEIFDLSKELNLDKEYGELLEVAIKVRNKGKIEEKYLFKNISFLNKIVMNEIKDDYKNNGDRIIL
jgi:predicted nucleotidyltransferase